MQVSIETTEGLERKMTVAVPSELVDTAVNERLQEAAKTVNLKGFRKGKVPLKVVRTRFGKGVRQEVVGELMNQNYYAAINQESLRPAGQPKIEATSIEEGEDLEFTAIFEVYPEIELPDFTKLSAERVTAKINESDIDNMIETLREQRLTWETVERPAADEDRVNIDFVGRLDGEEFEGGKAEGTDLLLGSGQMIAGFEAGIDGKSAGEKFTLPLTFPEKYHSTELAGKAVEFDISLNRVSEKVLPEINESFYESFGIEEGDNDAFRAEVMNNMDRELRAASRSKLKSKVADAVVSLVDIDVPESLVTAEIQGLREQALQQMGGGQNIDTSMLPDDLFKEKASRRVVLGLVLGEVIKAQELKADPEKVREAVEELASTYEVPEEVVNWYYNNKEELAGIESTVMENQVFDYIIDQAQVVDKVVSYADVIRPDPAATEA
ncbi:MAG: trigger factor [Gammaproteobacteria bacterium]|jgi:trigger factor|nr:trigger factor [Gammaproteobacteria bacterium]MDP6098091.1 trigger factor [Gammaproteobacteria bacterium]|tara:strand:+ start:3483 stop:4799 length:1317 start_codon:yes stop_codon:yes gene_type:complete